MGITAVGNTGSKNSSADRVYSRRCLFETNGVINWFIQKKEKQMYKTDSCKDVAKQVQDLHVKIQNKNEDNTVQCEFSIEELNNRWSKTVSLHVETAISEATSINCNALEKFD